MSAAKGPAVSVFTDGGLLVGNPSPIGGMWAWAQIDAEGWKIRHKSGVLVPSDVDALAVTNHHTECYAVLRALEALPDGWSGRICADNINALRVFCEAGPLNKLPHAWWPRIGAVLRRLGILRGVHFKGHPTQKDLARGRTDKGVPVSRHNVYVDKLCTEAGERFMLARWAAAATAGVAS